MEVFKNQTSGLFWIELGGVLLNNCSVDADCPGRAKCAVNASWAQHERMCFCEFIISMQGADCSELSSTTWFFYIGQIFAAIIASICFLVSLIDLVRMIRWKVFHRDALSTSLVFVLLGLFFTALQCAVSASYAVQVVIPDSTGSKPNPSAEFSIVLGLAYLFTTLAMLNVSVVWIEVAENVDRMKKSRSNNVSRYKTVLAVYYVFFIGTLAVALAIQNLLIAAAFAVPGVMFIIVTYVVGAYKMNKMLRSYFTSSTPAEGISTSKEALRKIRLSLQLIRQAALGVSFATFMFVVWMGLWVLLGGFATQPGQTFNTISVTLAWISVALGNGTVAWYLHGAIRRKIHSIASAEKIAIIAVEQAPRPSQQRGNLKSEPGKIVANKPISQDITSLVNTPQLERPELVTAPHITEHVNAPTRSSVPNNQ